MDSSRLRLALLYLIFFVSGGSSLISEITWNRMLVLVVGNTVTATSMILVAFMGGLALGSYWGARTFSKRRPSLLPYCILEICIGLYVLISPILFRLLSNLFAELAPAFTGSAMLPVARFAMTFALLFAPAFLMGATFPAMIAGAALGSHQDRAARTGYLYSINTLGAALGCLGAGYILLPKVGAQFTLVWAFLFNQIAAAGGLLLYALAKKREAIPSAQSKAESPPPTSPSPPEGRGRGVEADRSFLLLISIATFIVGFVALSYEVLLTRLVILYFGNQLIVFTLVLTAFLLGTGISAVLGTWAFGFISRTRHLYAFVTMMAGGSLVAPPFLLMALSASQDSWMVQNQGTIVVIIMLIPTFLMGGLLPIAIKLFQTGLQPNTTLNAGTLYALNAVGGMLGAGITNYFLVPVVGTQEVLSGFSVLFLAIGLCVLWSLRKSILRWSAAAACVALAGIVLMNLPHKLEGLYTRILNESSGNDIDPQLQLYYEGRVATVTVIDFPYLGFRDMFLNGVEEASTRFGHVQLFKLLGLLPVLMHESARAPAGGSDSPKEALTIAFGAGITAGATLDSGLVSSLDVVDLNPDIEMINDLFTEVNGDIYNKPKFNFIAEDGRNYLLMNPKKYSVIISDATHPRAYDSWILYTEEFYQSVKNHLTPDGVFAQWVPLSDFSLELYQILLNTFTRVFPYATLWNIYGTDQAFLLATPAPFVLDLKRLQEQLDKMPASLQLEEYQLDKAVAIAGFFVMDSETLSNFIGDEKRLNTDDLPFNQRYSLKKVSPLRTRSFDQYQASILPYLKNATDSDRTSIFERQVLARNIQRFFFFQDQAALDEAFAIRPTDGNVQYYRQLERKKMRMASEKIRKNSKKIEEDIRRLKKNIEASPHQGRNYIELARLYMDLNLIGNAEPLMKEALKYSPDSVQAHKMMGQIQATRGNWQEAVSMFQYIVQREPKNKSARKNLIRLFAEQAEYQKAIELLQGMIKEDNPEGPNSELYQHYIDLAGAYFSIKDFEAAEDSLLRSVAIYPNNTVARFYLANVYLQKKRNEEAVSQLKQILKINPYNEPALTRLIGLYKGREKEEELKRLEEFLNRARELRSF